jgi:tetratricopeptide (TPR) repeat protein
VLLVELGDQTAGIELVRETVEINDRTNPSYQSSEYLETLIALYLEAGKSEEALTWLDKLKKTAPQSPYIALFEEAIQAL